MFMKELMYENEMYEIPIRNPYGLFHGEKIYITKDEKPKHVPPRSSTFTKEN